MAPSKLEGLEIKRIIEIPEIEKKLSKFVNSLTIETDTWRDFEIKNGKRYIPHPIDGYACLDGEKIVGLSYFFFPKKYSLTYFIHKLFPPKETEIGLIVKKEYQRRGIASGMSSPRIKLMRDMGYERVIYIVLASNEVTLKWEEKKGHKPFKRIGNKCYFSRPLRETK